MKRQMCKGRVKAERTKEDETAGVDKKKKERMKKGDVLWKNNWMIGRVKGKEGMVHAGFKATYSYNQQEDVMM